jgi:hypothetical protein
MFVDFLCSVLMCKSSFPDLSAEMSWLCGMYVTFILCVNTEKRITG